MPNKLKKRPSVSSSTSERQPLLAPEDPDDPRADPAAPPPSSVSIPHLLASLAALRAHKLPSSAQTVAILHAFLDSSVLKVEGNVWHREFGKGRLGVGGLSREGDKVRMSVRVLLNAAVEILQKEVVRDDGVQELLYACQVAELDIHAPSVPLPREEGIEAAAGSFQKVFLVFFTSPELRSLLRDLVLYSKAALESSLVDTLGPGLGARATEVVDAVARDLTGVETDGSVPPTKEQRKGKESGEGWEGVEVGDDAKASKPVPPPMDEAKAARGVEQSGAEMRDEFIDRVKAIFTQIQTTPAYRSSVMTLLYLVKSYSVSLGDSLTPTASFTPPPNVDAPKTPLERFLPLLEAFSGGPGSLDNLKAAGTMLLENLKAPGSRALELLKQVEVFTTLSLLQPGYLNTSAAHFQLSQIHTAFSSLSSGPKVEELSIPVQDRIPHPLPLFIGEIIQLFHRIGLDPELRKLGIALEQVAGSLEGWMVQAGKISMGTEGVWGDIVEFLLPRLLGMLAEVPLPRIEFTSPQLDVAIDPPAFIATSFTPDRIHLETHSSFSIYPSTAPPPAVYSQSSWWPAFLRAKDVDDDLPPTARTSYSTTSTLHLTGLRFQARDIGYFAKYKNPWLCWPVVESGLVDILLGSAETKTQESKGVGQGGVDIVIQFAFDSPNHDANSPPPRKLFTLLNEPIATIPSFNIAAHSSSHPLTLWFMRPVMRKVVQTVIEQQVSEKLTELLEWFSDFGFEVRKKAREEGGKGYGWLQAVLEVFMEQKSEKEDEAKQKAKDAEEEAMQHALDERTEEGPPDDEESALHLSRKGVTYDLAPAPPVGPGEEPAKPEIVVGVGAEGVVIPPGEAETPQHRASAGEILEHGVGDVKRDAQAAAESLVEGVGEVLEGVEEFGEVVHAERKEVGWRSDAFDWAV